MGLGVIFLFAGVFWVGYGTASYGYCMVKGYNVPARQWFSPVKTFTWPADGNPGFVPKGRVFPGGGGSANTSKTSTSAAAVGLD